MSRSEIFEKLTEIFRDIFDDDSIKISESTTAADFEYWDSLAQVRIMVTCESEFNVKFDLNDIAAFKNVGDIADFIEKKLKR